MKRVFIIHGWGGHPKEGWFPWLRTELEKQGYGVVVPEMPETDWPKIETWIPTLAGVVGTPDAEAHFVGHSIGCQTILRYLETLSADVRVGKVALVAPWMTLSQAALTETEDSTAIAKPWIETPIDWAAVQPKAQKFFGIMSDDDPFVPISDGEIFRQRLGAEIEVVSGWGHFSGSDGITELPQVLTTLLQKNIEKNH